MARARYLLVSVSVTVIHLLHQCAEVMPDYCIKFGTGDVRSDWNLFRDMVNIHEYNILAT